MLGRSRPEPTHAIISRQRFTTNGKRVYKFVFRMNTRPRAPFETCTPNRRAGFIGKAWLDVKKLIVTERFRGEFAELRPGGLLGLQNEVSSTYSIVEL